MQVLPSCLDLHKLFYPHLESPGKNSPLFWASQPPKNPWNSILQLRLEMSRCNQIGDLSPLGLCQCFRERHDYSINHWNNHPILTLLDYNADADVASCPSCVMSVATRVFHMSFTDSTLDKKMFVKCRTACTNIHWHQVSHRTTHRKTPLLSVWMKRTLWGSPWVQVPSTPQSLTNMLFGPSTLSHGHITWCFITTDLALLSPSSSPQQVMSQFSRWLSTPKGHPCLGSCQFSRYGS